MVRVAIISSARRYVLHSGIKLHRSTYVRLHETCRKQDCSRFHTQTINYAQIKRYKKKEPVNQDRFFRWQDLLSFMFKWNVLILLVYLLHLQQQNENKKNQAKAGKTDTATNNTVGEGKTTQAPKS